MKAVFCLLVVALLMHTASAQLFVDVSPLYQLTDGTIGTDKIRHLPDGRGRLIVRPDEPEQRIYPASQVAYFHRNNRLYEPVAHFTVRLEGQRTVHIDQDFAMVLDTGRIILFEHILSVNLPDTGASRVYSQWSYLLRVRGQSNLIVIRDTSSKFDDGALDSADQQSLLSIFQDDPQLPVLLKQQKLTSKNLRAYVLAYNQQHRPAR